MPQHVPTPDRIYQGMAEVAVAALGTAFGIGKGIYDIVKQEQHSRINESLSMKVDQLQQSIDSLQAVNTTKPDDGEEGRSRISDAN